MDLNKMNDAAKNEESDAPPATPVRVNTQRTVLLARNSLEECFGFALQTYVFKRGPYGLKERITYIDYVRDNSIAAAAGVQEGDVVLAVNGSPVLQESHADLVKLMSSQLELRLVLLYQDISRNSCPVRSEGSLSTAARRARWLSVCQDISKSLNLYRKLLNKDSKPEFYRLCPAGPSSTCCDVPASYQSIQQNGKDTQSKTTRNTCRMTSSGPPPASPSKPGSFSARYEAFISRWPTIHGLHRMVVDGSRWCFSDIKTYIRLKRELSSDARTLENLSMPELEVLVQMPTELPRVAVCAVLLPLPFGFYVIAFAIILFPRFILTRHFWSDRQRTKFFQMDIEHSLANTSLRKIIGNPSSVEQVRLPNLNQLSFEALIALSSLHSIYPLPGVRRRFTLRCKAMRQLDKILESNLKSLTERQLQF
ncbi:PDZ/DHR/GLGF domain protein, partial [Ostertagia ostertagi]